MSALTSPYKHVWYSKNAGWGFKVGGRSFTGFTTDLQAEGARQIVLAGPENAPTAARLRELVPDQLEDALKQGKIVKNSPKSPNFSDKSPKLSDLETELRAFFSSQPTV